MTPDKSIYDLARVVFAGNMVTLKEHFRCVPAIIEFSNREFYQGDIRPLRLPRANERLDPPLIDVFVKGGMRKRDVNPAEAKAIVDEIEAMLEDEDVYKRQTNKSPSSRNYIPATASSCRAHPAPARHTRLPTS